MSIITVQFGLFSVFYHHAELCTAFVSVVFIIIIIISASPPPVEYDRLSSLQVVNETIPGRMEMEWLL